MNSKQRDNLKRLVKDAKKSIGGLSDHLGLTRQGLDYMLSRETLSLEHAKQIAEYCQVQIQDVLAIVNPESTIVNVPTVVREDGYLMRHVANLEAEIKYLREMNQVLLGKSEVVPKGRLTHLFFTKRVHKQVQPISVHR